MVSYLEHNGRVSCVEERRGPQDIYDVPHLVEEPGLGAADLRLTQGVQCHGELHSDNKLTEIVRTEKHRDTEHASAEALRSRDRNNEPSTRMLVASANGPRSRDDEADVNSPIVRLCHNAPTPRDCPQCMSCLGGED